MLKDSIYVTLRCEPEVRDTLHTEAQDATLKYIYDEETALLHLDSFHNMMGQHSMEPTLETFSRVLSIGFSITITTRRCSVTSLTSSYVEQPDWSVAVDQMEAAKRIVVKREQDGKPSTSDYVMALDDRRFWYPDRPEDVYHVDCLGTAFCRDITEEFVAEHAKIEKGV